MHGAHHSRTERGASKVAMTRPVGGAPRYAIIIPEETRARAIDYAQALRVGGAKPGALLHDRLRGTDLGALTEHDLLEALFDTNGLRSSPRVKLPATARTGA